MKLLAPLLLTLGAALSGCRSPADEPSPGATVACTCGQPETDFEGCAHALCIAGKRNPDNPDCVCGPLELEAQGGKR